MIRLSVSVLAPLAPGTPGERASFWLPSPPVLRGRGVGGEGAGTGRSPPPQPAPPLPEYRGEGSRQPQPDRRLDNYSPSLTEPNHDTRHPRPAPVIGPVGFRRPPPGFARARPQKTPGHVEP